MNIKMSIAIFILLSFFNIGAISNDTIFHENSFNVVEKNTRNISVFEENGVKIQYKTKDNIEEESSRIKDNLTTILKRNYDEIGKNEFNIENKSFDINTKLWCEDKYTYVEITLINKNSKCTINDLLYKFQKLKNDKSENVQYFLYYKGKVNEQFNKNYINKLINCNCMKNIKLLSITNGYTGIGHLEDGNKVNFALIKYNTGSHIIIGTPIIFATY